MNIYYLWSDAPSAVTINNYVFWDIMLCSPVRQPIRRTISPPSSWSKSKTSMKPAWSRHRAQWTPCREDRIYSLRASKSACCLLLPAFLFGLLFNPEVWGDMFLRNVGCLSQDYMALWPRRQLIYNLNLYRCTVRKACVNWWYDPPAKIILCTSVPSQKTTKRQVHWDRFRHIWNMYSYSTRISTVYIPTVMASTAKLCTGQQQTMLQWTMKTYRAETPTADYRRPKRGILEGFLKPLRKYCYFNDAETKHWLHGAQSFLRSQQLLSLSRIS
jgi:hypothetical protein